VQSFCQISTPKRTTYPSFRSGVRELTHTTGFSWGPSSLKCSGNSSPKCSSSQWYHERSDSCCDNSWGWNPPSGSCPHGVSCPSDWFWHKDHQKCVPNHPRSPAPDCGNWNDHDRQFGSTNVEWKGTDEMVECCGSHQPQPSSGTGSNGGHSGHSKYSVSSLDQPLMSLLLFSSSLRVILAPCTFR
jgi:hypothetical protein